MRVILPILCALASAAPARAACDVKGAGLEEAIAAKGELRETANAQTVRDLRTLRDAAIVLDAYKYEPECERVMAIVKALAADPERAIEQGGDTDEDKAETVVRSREPKPPVPGAAPAPK